MTPSASSTPAMTAQTAEGRQRSSRQPAGCTCSSGNAGRARRMISWVFGKAKTITAAPAIHRQEARAATEKCADDAALGEPREDGQPVDDGGRQVDAVQADHAAQDVRRG